MPEYTWGDWLADWTKNIYEPFYAPQGIEKGTALISHNLAVLSQSLRQWPDRHGDMIKRVAKELEGNDKPWERPE